MSTLRSSGLVQRFMAGIACAWTSITSSGTPSRLSSSARPAWSMWWCVARAYRISRKGTPMRRRLAFIVPKVPGQPMSTSTRDVPALTTQ